MPSLATRINGVCSAPGPDDRLSLIAEVAAGFLTGSLALISDAAHVYRRCGALAIALAAGCGAEMAAGM